MRKMLASFLLLAVIFSSAIICVHATNSVTFTLTDPESDMQYEINNNDGYISIRHDDNVLCSAYIKNADGYSLYGGILTIYTMDNLNLSLGVYNFDFLNDSMDSFAICGDAYRSNDCFAKNAKGIVYFVSDYNSKYLCEYSDGKLRKIDVNAQISQLLCVDGESIIVVTSECTYIYHNGTAEKTLDYPLSIPASYTGKGKITDSSGKEYTFENFSLKEVLPIAESENLDHSEPPKVYSDSFIAESGTTVSKIKKAFADSEITEIRKADGTVIKSGKLGTGATVKLTTGETITVVIYGEVTGEGNINSRDLKALLNHLSRKEYLSGSFLSAADADNDGEITTKDALKISLMY